MILPTSRTKTKIPPRTSDNVAKVALKLLANTKARGGPWEAVGCDGDRFWVQRDLWDYRMHLPWASAVRLANRKASA